MVNLLSSFDELLNSKAKAKPSGLPDSNFIFFLATKKRSKRKLGAALGMSGSSGRQHQFNLVYLTKFLHIPRRTRGS